MATQTYGSLTNEQKTFYDRALLKRLTPNLVFQQFGQKKSIPSNEGGTVNFRKFGALTANTTPLVEGVTPASKSLNITTSTATVAQYGDYVEISDKLDLLGIDPVLTETAGVLGEQAGLTLDTIIRDIVCAGTNVIYSGSASAVNTATEKIKSSDIMRAVRVLRNNNAKPVDGKYYIGIVDSDVAFDIMSDPLWQDISKYSGGTAIMDGEIGKLAGVRFIETSNTKKTNTEKTHMSMIIGKDAYGVVDVEGSAKPEMIVKPLGSGGTTDPLNQRATCAWKACMAAQILDNLAMVRIESGVSA